MSEHTKDGGPAFPTKCRGTSQDTAHIECFYLGMTLRDYFAAHALSGLLADTNFGRGMLNSEIAKRAFAMADAMIEAREK